MGRRDPASACVQALRTSLWRPTRTRDSDTRKARYTAFARGYLNKAAAMKARNPSYPGWAAEGHLAVAPGNETDFGRIEGDVLELCRRHRVASVGFDPWQSTQMA